MRKVEELGESLEGKLSQCDLAEFEHENFGANFKFGLFRQLTIYVDKYASVVRETLAALEDIMEQEKGIVMPAMESFDPQSVFFLSYAQSLCSHETDFQRDIDRTSGSVLLNRQKLQGTLSQVPEFYHFYFCGHDSSLSCGKII